MIAALYLRVSTTDQDLSNQRQALHKAAELKGWTIAAEFHDTASGKSRQRRPGLVAALAAAERHEYQVLMCWSLDRLGRSILDLLTIAKELQATGTDLYLDQHQVDTTTAAGKLLFNIMGAFADFERNMIVERTNAGLARARAEGRRGGRPLLDPRKHDKVLELLYAGRSYREIAREVQVSKGYVSRQKAIINQAEAAQP